MKKLLFIMAVILGVFALRAQAQSVTTIYSFTENPPPAYPYAQLTLGPDGYFYGTSDIGGSSDYGTVFKVSTNGSLTTLLNFNSANGANPYAGLALGSDGYFYGTTYSGGSSGWGTLFKLSTNGSLTTLVNFNSANGANPYAGLALGMDGNFYGTTYSGGGNNEGTVFKLNTNGSLTTLVNFNSANGANPYAGLALGMDGNFYGTTYSGGGNNEGTVFKLNTNGSLTTLVNFNSANGANPYAGLTLGSDGYFYGTTYSGGSSGWGTLFKVSTNGSLTTLVNFNYSNGAFPYAGLTLSPDQYFYGTTTEGSTSGYGSVFKVSTNGNMTILANFDDLSNGAYSKAGLTLGSDGCLYGTTTDGGLRDAGTIFKISTNGSLTILSSLPDTTSADGGYPYAGLVLGTDGYFYGATSVGGIGSGGTVFKTSTNGNLTTLASFNSTNGGDPRAGMTLGADGCFYGVTQYGGINNPGTIFKLSTNSANSGLITLDTFPPATYDNGAFFNADGANFISRLTLSPNGYFYGATFEGGYYGNGTLFKISTNGALTTLYSFSTSTYDSSTGWQTNSDGTCPLGSLTLGTDGYFYGTTSQGGGLGCGTVFKLGTNDVLTTLVSFNSTNGENPRAGLTLGPDGYFYGTSMYGGSTASGGSVGYGTIFKINTNGNLTSLVSFNTTNGSYPCASLTLGPDGYFYGTTMEGGSSDDGTLFKLNTNGSLTILVSLSATNGATPHASLTLGTDGNFYGTTTEGGSSNSGAIFQLELPPDLITGPTNQSSFIGDSATFNCQPFGTAPFGYQWLSNGIPLAGATGNSLMVVNISAQTTNAQFQVEITNAWGNITSGTAKILVDAAPQLPVFTLQPASVRTNAGSTVSFASQAAGATPLGYNWYFSGGSLSRATNATLTLTNVTTNQAGNYWVVATNSYGGATSVVVTLVLLLQPTLSISPSSASDVAMSFSATPTNTYLVQFSTDLLTWHNLATYGPITTTTNISVSVNRFAFNHIVFRLVKQ